MSDPRLRFLFGDALPDDDELDGIDLDDVDVRAELLRQGSPPDGEPYWELLAEAITSQIHLDEPPEVWSAAQRLLRSGLDREEVFEQLAVALSLSVRSSRESDGLDADAYRAALDHLPLPAPAQVVDAIVDVLRADQGVASHALYAAVLARLGLDAGDELGLEVVDAHLEHLLDEGGPVAYLPDDRMVHVPSLLDGVVLTRRLTETEAGGGVLNASFDLAAFDRSALWLPTGDEVGVVSVEPGHLAWLGPEDWLGEVEAGDVLAVTVDGDDVVTVNPVLLPDRPDPELVERIRAAYEDAVDRMEQPVDSHRLVLSVVVDAPELFRKPQLPLEELVLAAGLEVRRHLVAHDEVMWAGYRRSMRLRVATGVLGRHDLERVRQAVGVLTLAEALAGTDAATSDDPSGADLVGGDPSGAALAGDKDVVALFAHGHAEAEGFLAALLADDFVKGLKLLGGLEGE
jgi:hypothetical protein